MEAASAERGRSWKEALGQFGRRAAPAPKASATEATASTALPRSSPESRALPAVWCGEEAAGTRGTGGGPAPAPQRLDRAACCAARSWGCPSGSGPPRKEAESAESGRRALAMPEPGRGCNADCTWRAARVSCERNRDLLALTASLSSSTTARSERSGALTPPPRPGWWRGRGGEEAEPDADARARGGDAGGEGAAERARPLGGDP